MVPEANGRVIATPAALVVTAATPVPGPAMVAVTTPVVLPPVTVTFATVAGLLMRVQRAFGSSQATTISPTSLELVCPASEV
jgi:hypothetical protein